MSALPFSSQNGNCQGQIIIDQNLVITIKGRCNVPGDEIKYAAAAPANFRLSYMGSGLPFPNEDIAYEGSPNIGKAPIINGKFEFAVTCPNSYYKDNGATVVDPHVHFTVGSEYFDIPLPLAKLFPNRSLTSIHGRPNRVTRR